MSDTRKRNVNWLISTDINGQTSHEDAELAVLMDIRDELQGIKRTLQCSTFTRMPYDIAAIKKNTTKPKRKKNAPHNNRK